MQAINDDIQSYTCCQGYFPLSGRLNEGRSPHICLLLEAPLQSLLPAQSLRQYRAPVQQQFQPNQRVFPQQQIQEQFQQQQQQVDSTKQVQVGQDPFTEPNTQNLKFEAPQWYTSLKKSIKDITSVISEQRQQVAQPQQQQIYIASPDLQKQKSIKFQKQTSFYVQPQQQTQQKASQPTVEQDPFQDPVAKEVKSPETPQQSQWYTSFKKSIKDIGNVLYQDHTQQLIQPIQLNQQKSQVAPQQLTQSKSVKFQTQSSFYITPQQSQQQAYSNQTITSVSMQQPQQNIIQNQQSQSAIQKSFQRRGSQTMFAPPQSNFALQAQKNQSFQSPPLQKQQYQFKSFNTQQPQPNVLYQQLPPGYIT